MNSDLVAFQSVPTQEGLDLKGGLALTSPVVHGNHGFIVMGWGFLPIVNETFLKSERHAQMKGGENVVPYFILTCNVSWSLSRI